MRSDPAWRRYVRFWGTNVDADIDDEMRFHIETRVEELVERGLAPHAARAQALEEYGDVTTFRRQLRQIDHRTHGRRASAERWDAVLRDVRFAARTLRRSPTFTAMAVACVALGVCVTTTIFSAVHSILIRPLPYARADELVAVYSQNPGLDIRGSNISYPDYVSWRTQNRSFAALGIWTWQSFALSGDETEAERVEGAAVAANLFPLLGVRPILGRSFLEEEEQSGNEKKILIGHGLWQRRFGGDRSLVGRTITVDGLPFTVVGIMPPRFSFPDRGEAWVPFSVPDWGKERENRGFAGAIGRLKPGATFDQARADLARIDAALVRDYPRENRGWAAEPKSLREDLLGDLRRPLLVFAGAVALVLLIACANVANLMLARGATREREIAVRVAVGAGRGRLVRQVLTESLVLAAVGGALGAGLSYFGVRLLRLAFPEDLPFYITLELDRTALAFAVLATTLSGVLFGIAPALRTTSVDVGASLKEGGRGAVDGGARSRLRATLVVAEVALSVVLMIGAMLLIRSYRALEGTNLGFDRRGIVSMRISLPPAKYDKAARVVAFYDRLLERVRAMPGVQSVGSARGTPFSGWNVHTSITLEGQASPPAPGQERFVLNQVVTPDYLRTIGVPILRGRGFTPTDRDSVAPVGVVNERFVKDVLHGADPLGKRVKLGGAESTSPWVTIVGVMRDYRHYRLPEPMDAAVFLPYASDPRTTQMLAIRTSLRDPYAIVPAVRAAVRELDATVPVYRVETFEDIVSRSLWRQRLQGEVLGVFAALALLLASVGLYGVIAYAVAQRTRELGVRMALGATRRHVVGLVLGQGARLTVIGVVIGAVAALALSRVVASLLYGVKASDPLTFVAVPAALAGVALLASYAPARRAMKVDPLVAMRAE